MSASREFFSFCRASSLSSLLNCQSPSMFGRGRTSGFFGIAGGGGALVELTSDGGAASGPGGACALPAHAQTRHVPLITATLPNGLIFVTFLRLALQDYPFMAFPRHWPQVPPVPHWAHSYLGFADRRKWLLPPSSLPLGTNGCLRSNRHDLLRQPALQIPGPLQQPQGPQFPELLRPLPVIPLLLRKNRQERHSRRLGRQRVINIISNI